MKITIELANTRELYDLRKLLNALNGPEFSLDTSIDAVNLTIRTVESLKAGGILDIGTLVNKTEHELLQLPNLGRKSLNEIKDCLDARGMRLNA